MKIDTVKIYILNQLNSFMVDNELKILNERTFDSYGFEICIGNNINYIFINYCTHNYRFENNIIVGFGKRAFIKDRDLKYISMKPHYCINDFYEGFNSKMSLDFKKDKGTIDKVCDLIPPVYKKLANQSDEHFINNLNITKN